MTYQSVFFIFLFLVSGISRAYAQTQAVPAAEDSAAPAPANADASSGAAAAPAAAIVESKDGTPIEQKILLDSYEVVTDEIESFRNAKQHASTAAKSLGRSLSLYIKEKAIQKKQQELVMRFQSAFNDIANGLKLNDNEREHLLLEVEEVYIKDSETGGNKLDQFNFRDLPDIVQMKFAEIELARTENGTVDTYYPSGELKTRWILKKGKPDGAIITYYENGEMLYIDIYESGRKIDRKKYDAEGKLEFEQDYSYAPKKSGSPAPADANTEAAHA